MKDAARTIMRHRDGILRWFTSRNGWPLAGEGTTVPVASTAQPAVRCSTSSG